MKYAPICFLGITPKFTTKMEGDQNFSAAPEKRSSYELGGGEHYLSGGSSETTLVSKESTVLFSETKQNTKRVSLSDRLTKSLISAGLVKGTIPMSMRKKSNQLTLDTASRWQDGSLADIPRSINCLYLNDEAPDLRTRLQ